MQETAIACEDEYQARLANALQISVPPELSFLSHIQAPRIPIPLCLRPCTSQLEEQQITHRLGSPAEDVLASPQASPVQISSLYLHSDDAMTEADEMERIIQLIMLEIDFKIATHGSHGTVVTNHSSQMEICKDFVETWTLDKPHKIRSKRSFRKIIEYPDSQDNKLKVSLNIDAWLYSFADRRLGSCSARIQTSWVKRASQ